MARGDNNQVVYVAGDVPQLPLQLGQLLVDSSQVSPGITNLQQCTSQDPLVYEPIEGSWPRTAAEIAAGVIPTNYFIPSHEAVGFVNVRRYGAILDGVTNDTASFMEAFAVASAANGGTVGYDGNTICKNLAIPDGITIKGCGNYTIGGAPTAATDYILTATGALTGVSQALSTDGLQGASQVSVASSAGLAVGDYVIVGEDVYVTGTDGRSQQITKITDITGAGPFVLTLRDTLFQAYQTANSANIAKFTPVRFKLIDVILANPQPTQGANDGGCMNLLMATEVRLQNVELSGASRSAALKTYTCSDITGDVWIHDCPGGSTGSSVGLACYINNTHDLRLYTKLERVTQCSLEFVSRFCDISFDAENVRDSAWNTHGNGNTDCLFHDFTINGSDSVGFAIGYGTQATHDERISFRSGKIRNTVSHGCSVSGKAGNQNTGCVIEDIEISAYKTSGAITTAGLRGSFADDLSVSGVRIDGATIAVATDSAFRFSNCARLKLDDSRAANVPSGYGLQLTDCTDYKINSLDIKGAANYINTSGSTSSYAGACAILGCTADVLAPTLSIEAAVYQMGNSWNAGTFTATLTGMTGSVTGTWRYERIGWTVRIDNNGGLSGTGNSASVTSTGLPSFLKPTNQQRIYAHTVLDNGTNKLGRVTVETSGVFTYATDFNGAPFAGAGATGVSRCTFLYGMN